MKFVNGNIFSQNLSKLTMGGLLITLFFCGQSAFAVTDYMFFSVNGDTTLSSMTQGDELFWGANCDLGATINWEVWYDVNSNSTVDPTVDFLITSENITDGNLLTESDPILDGWAIGDPFKLGAEPGDYIFKAKDLATESTVQGILTMVAMSSPPNQLTGQISIPGYPAPNSFLANRFVIAESDTGDEGAFLAATDINGFYSINIGANGTGVEFYVWPTNVHDFVGPEATAAIASGVVANIDFTYTAATDSVWGFVKDELGSLLNFENDVSADKPWPADMERYTTTANGRYVIYFSNPDKGDWELEASSRLSPNYLWPERFAFSHDTIGSFQHDIILTRVDTAIYVRITENGGLPGYNYLINGYSSVLSSSTEVVSGTGTDNIAALPISSLDNSDWMVSLNTWDYDFPIPAGFIVVNSAISSLAPGDTVTFDLVDGFSVSGTITQDPEDEPVNWDDIFVAAGNFSGSYFNTGVGTGGAYSLYMDTGSFYMGIEADGYISNPAWRSIYITGDTTGGLGFTINETHCRLNGTLLNVTLPLDASYYQVIARTGTDGPDGYFVLAQVDSTTGTYTMDLCDGNWTIIPPCCFPNFNTPDSAVITIGESPDTVRTQDFEYSVILGVGDDDENSLPRSFTVNQNYPNPFNPVTTIDFTLPARSHVTVDIFNILGQNIRTLASEYRVAGSHSVSWDSKDNFGQGVSTGIYFYRIQAGDHELIRKMFLLK